jgi:hypothetical protein
METALPPAEPPHALELAEELNVARVTERRSLGSTYHASSTPTAAGGIETRRARGRPART